MTFRPAVLTFVATLLSVTPLLAQRLPQTVTPEHYDLTVAPDLAKAAFTGEETIRVRLAKPSQKITLNAAEIAFGDVTIVAAGKTQKAAVAVDEKIEQVSFTVPAAIPAGLAEIHISTRGSSTTIFAVST